MLEILLSLNAPPTTDDFEKVLLCDSLYAIGITHDMLSSKNHRALFSKSWLKILRCELSMDGYKKVLLVIHKKVIPYMTEPTLLMDFLTDSYNAGGVVSLLSLNGLFVLIQEHHLYV